MFCGNCGANLPEKAKFCPKCGIEIQAGCMVNASGKKQTTVNNKRVVKTWWIWLIVVLIVAIYFNVVDDRNDDLDATVILCAQNEVSKILKSASTAHWGAGEILDKDQFDRYLVYIPLEAQNGFGAYSKSYFLVIVSDVTLDGQYTFMTFGSRLEIVNFTNASVPSVVTDYKNGEIAPIVQNFLENNRWGEDPDKET